MMLRTFMHRLVHGVLSFVMVFLAYSFADDVPTFQSSISYDAMARFMDELHWAAACGGVGTIGLTTVFAKNWNVRIGAAVILGIGHLVIALLIYLGNRHATGTGLFFGYGALGLGLAYSTAHLSRRTAEDLDPFDIP